MSHHAPTFFATSTGRPAFVTAEFLEEMNRQFESCTPQEILEWCLTNFRTGVSLGTSFGPSGLMMMDMALKIDPHIDIYYLNTEYLFPQTMEQIVRAEEHFGRSFRSIMPHLTIAQQAERYGPALYSTDPNQCCKIRKVYTQIHALKDSSIWITSIRRDQSPTRADTPFIAWNDKFNVLKLTPMAEVTGEQVWAYVKEHNLPYNELHDQGYPSIGCWPCTQPVLDGEDERAGRWRGMDKTECGLQTDDDSQEELALTGQPG